MKRSIFVGYDKREAVAFSVAMGSAARHLSEFIPVHGLHLPALIDKGLYRRPMKYFDTGLPRKVMWDEISDAPMATEHACARFLVKELAQEGWALFMDGDMLVRGDLAPLFGTLDPAKALYCVQHRHEPPPGVKMDGQMQTRYARKNWSSFMIVNCDHPANEALTVDLINTVPGRDLHRFSWIEDDDLIGELPPEYNFLVGHTDPAVDPICVHFTSGTPDMPGYENCAWASEWRAEVNRRAA